MDAVDKDSLNQEALHHVIFELVDSLSIIKELSELEAQSIEEKQLVQQALTILLKNQGAGRCSFYRLNEQNKLVYLTGVNWDESNYLSSGPLIESQFEIGKGIIGLAAQSGEIQHCANTSTDAFFEIKSSTTDWNKSGSILSAPVNCEDKLFGVINISHPEAYYFSEWQVRLIDVYKNLLSQLLTKSRLFQQMEFKIAERTEALEKTLDHLKTLKDRFEAMSIIDELTGLHNRRYLYSQTETALSYAIRHKHPLCCLLLDLDYFKDINDNYGHPAGDKVLKDVASTLKTMVRDVDILSRLGGEEFVIVFTNTDYETGILLAEKVRKSVQLLAWFFAEESVNITVSIGVCYFDYQMGKDHKFTVDRLIHQSDMALYEAKQNGRDQVVVYKQGFENLSFAN